MARLKTIGALLLIALFVVLPLYEFADIGEQWPHDGDVVLILLFVLFVAALLIILRGIACACLALRRVPSSFARPLRHSAAVYWRCCSEFPLFLLFCDLRI